jgi:hypothetical protein
MKTVFLALLVALTPSFAVAPEKRAPKWQMVPAKMMAKAFRHTFENHAGALYGAVLVAIAVPNFIKARQRALEQRAFRARPQ